MHALCLSQNILRGCGGAKPSFLPSDQSRRGHPMSALLDIKDLRVTFNTRYGEVTALDSVSLHVNEGETLGVVGESGCGKSITALATMGLIPSPPGRIAGRLHCAQRRRAHVRLRGPPAGPARRRNSNDFSRADDLAQPRLHSWRANSRGHHATPEGQPRHCHERRRGPARSGGDPLSRRARARLPTSAFRWDASARDDRDGCLLPSKGAHRRRANHST